jgi:hypothetical protein
MSPLAKWCGICVLTLVMGFIPAHSVAARNLTAVEQAALTEAVDHYSAYLKTQDWRAMLEASIPPRMLDEMVKGSGQPKEQLLKAIAELMAETMAKLAVQSYSMDLAKAETREHADGTPFVFIPTELTLAVNSGDKVAVHSHTLGMMDATKWYLVRVTDPKQQQLLVRTYPEYEGVEFPGEKTEILKE